ncbi:MAG: response regulator [Planctomycetes bacterium]|nr:response regulator [Planctomycetota bacterium]
MMDVRTGRSASSHVLISHTDRPGGTDWIRGLTTYFEPYSIRVRQVYTGPDTISLIEAGQVDAAVLSIDMPKLDGLGILRTIRSIDDRLPCVMVTADASSRTLRRALDLGAYSVVTCPVDLQAITRVMAGLFRRFLDWELDERA